MTYKQRTGPLAVKVDKNTWIPLSDGTKLAARIWMPKALEELPVPAVLEYLPYRKNDGTAFRDESMHSYIAAHGYACIRVDIRGSGDSDGLLHDEYLPQEQQDALEVLTWISSQPWCTGDVGMIGISWGGFNGLQTAALRPPELKAIITLCSADDRYNDDCHYMGGCVLGSDMLSWASVMLAYNGLPPDPTVAGDQWRDMWFHRLENSAPFIDQWLKHQQLDDFWKQGSVREDYSSIACAVYAVGGWTDPYTNSIPRLLSGLSSPSKGLIGPWQHQFPHSAVPGPAIGFLQECLRWWDYWLKGIDNGIMDEPQLRLWMPEGIPPQPFEAEWPGRWVAEEKWPAANNTQQVYYFNEGHLTENPETDKVAKLQGCQITGVTAGTWCPNGNSIGLPIDQRADDGLSLCFTSAPLHKAVEILGFPQIELKITSDQPNALLSVRLCDIAPDGYSRLISWGLLNLTHRESHETPIPLIPGQAIDTTIQLNYTAYRLPEGHRWRIAISPTYWPHAWPSPIQVKMALYCGANSRLILPIRSPSKADITLSSFAKPEHAPPLESEWLRLSESSRNIQFDVGTVYLCMTDRFDEGRRRITECGLTTDSVVVNTYSIKEGEPLSAKVECSRQIELSRGDWVVRVKTNSTMTSDINSFHITNILDAYEGSTRVFTKSWTSSIHRGFV